MIATLVRLRLMVWRRTPNPLRGVGVLLGVFLALWTVWIGLGWWGGPGSSGDLLATAFALWLVGWMLGPVQSGGGQLLRPDWFALLPLRPRRLARGLLLASVASIGTVLTLIAALGLVAYGARSGLMAALAGAGAGLLQVVMMIVASKLITELLSSAARSRIATAVVSAQWGLFIAVMLIGWFVVAEVAQAASTLTSGLAGALPGGIGVLLRAVPSGWGVAVVEATADGNAPLALAALIGLAAVTWCGVRLWAWLLHRRMTGGRIAAAGRPRPLRRRVLPATPLGAVISKDLRTWWRDPRRGIEVRSALWAGLFITAGLWLLVPDVLAFSGVLIALIGAMACVNVYAMDGTGLWHTLSTPAAERVDVRGRQISWLLIFTPAAVLPCLIGVVATQATWAIPWVLALVPALLGGAAGLIPLLSIVALAPETDAHKRSGNPAETGAEAAGLYFAMLGATLLTVAPALIMLALSVVNQDTTIAWWAVAVGVGSGAAWAWGLGRIAWSRLAARGPELLQLMRVGPQRRSPGGEPVRRTPAATSWKVGAQWTISLVALFPQGLVPLTFTLFGIDERVWFLPLFLPAPWQYPAIAGFIAIGLMASRWALRRRRETRRAAIAATLSDRARADRASGNRTWC